MKKKPQPAPLILRLAVANRGQITQRWMEQDAGLCLYYCYSLPLYLFFSLLLDFFFVNFNIFFYISIIVVTGVVA